MIEIYELIIIFKYFMQLQIEIVKIPVKASYKTQEWFPSAAVICARWITLPRLKCQQDASSNFQFTRHNNHQEWSLKISSDLSWFFPLGKEHQSGRIWRSSISLFSWMIHLNRPTLKSQIRFSHWRQSLANITLCFIKSPLT